MTPTDYGAPHTPLQRADMQLAAVNQLRWYPGPISISATDITLSGWALGVWDLPTQYRFLVNGIDFQELEWPMPSPYLAPIFGGVPYADAAHFRCQHRFRAEAPPFEDGFMRLNVTTQFGEHALSYKTAWYLADPATEPPMPSDAQIARVIGSPDPLAYRVSGATLARRLDAFLRQRFGRPVSSFESILDWGCGAGRLTRYLPIASSSVTGIDIDADNIAACASHLPHARFQAIDRHPPTPFANASFDLVFGMSVLTHLDEAAQHAWLGELRRIVRPGGVLLLTILGQAQAHLYQDWGGNRMATHRKGIHVAGANPQLSDVLDEPAYYQDVQHSHDYVLATWASYFDVLDIVPALACGQDVVVLRARS